ncbi:prophage integrase [Mycobacteroides abscessus subsp. abscessus]|uniref:site-specific integrase n=1 Tax=Mycobacteroides abscessus TaxID=36809 RepID=UPI000925C15F|nr:site-specific integrase [Mycobacteroides abscessus]SHU93457.1 prophage integrase [Mycobacteroides abscessus subsp. abscessus]SHX73123.1 prophage integrase [Mycobacteroides abscessus subsp. abscessus]SIG86846.1 prophage integrase [Mycobacteroides abscessus subsp. abscessus]SKD18818.1 prophage integrase [Mycobacteroides abscessus subsp. abscessus]SKN10176.1 prophage integrase [Mycobacteroides abscessus subsp. abscessus]
MSITKYATKSGPRWRVEWQVPGRAKRRKIFHTEREARTFEAEVVSSRSRGIVVDPRRGASITVEYAYERWLASRQDFSAKVRRGYEDCWRISVQPAFGLWPLTRVDRHSIQEWVNTMTVGPRTRRWRHSVLRMVLQYAVEQDWLVKNPSTATSFPPMPTHDHTYLTADEVERLATLCGQQGDIVLILAYTGLRWGELTGLRVTDIDLPARRLRVRRSITQVGGKLILGATKSRAGVRTVPIPTRIVPLLAQRIKGKAPDAPAVTSPRGALLSRENWVRSVRWNEQRKSLGKPRLRIHDLRHTYAHLYDTELDSLADALDSLITSSAGTHKQNDGPLVAHQEQNPPKQTELDREENAE